MRTEVCISRYIDRADLFNSLSNAKTVGEVFAAIQSAPAANVVEVRHGRWEKHLVPTDFDGEVFNVEHIVCSVCESAIPLNKTYKRDWYSDYCPSCGSRMDLDEAEK